MIVQSLGALAVETLPWTVSGQGLGALRLYDTYYYSYATLYATQPNVRTCVEFLGRNIAQLGLHVFQRVGETDRRRLRDHPLALVIETPLPAEYKMTRYRMIEATIQDMAIYHNAFWLKIRDPRGLQLLRIPPPYMSASGTFYPTGYTMTVGGQRREFPPTEVVHFRGYNPSSTTTGLSPLETLRRVLAEETAMGDYRENYWQNAARMSGIVERPKDAPEWSKVAQERFTTEFAQLYSGNANSGKTAVLEDGMTFKPVAFDAQQSEYLGARKLTREECARAYHIPLPMVGILDHATFSNIKEQHKNLYQDSLGPWLAMLEDDIELQLLPEWPTPKGVYVEFNIQEKLQGSFEEQTASLQTAVGRPWMTPDEARARMNLQSMGGEAAALGMPLNIMVGAPEEPVGTPAVQGGTSTDQAQTDTDAQKDWQRKTRFLGVPRNDGRTKAKQEIDPTLPRSRARHVEQWHRVLGRFFRRQEQAIVSRVKPKAGQPIGEVWGDGERWDEELAEDLYKISRATASVWARYVTDALGTEFDDTRMDEYLQQRAVRSAENINETTRQGVIAALVAELALEAVQHLFDIAETSRAAQIAQSGVTQNANFGSHEGARQGGLTTKTWQVNSANPRDEHAAVNGETVAIGEMFSNGMRWPGDPSGGVDEIAGCQCSVRFGR